MRRRRTGAMLVLATCFSFSAIARLTEPVATAGETGAAAPSAAAAMDAETALMGELLLRAKALDEREAKSAEREKIIAAAEVRLRKQIQALEKAERRLATVVEVASEAAEADLSRLVAAYQAMDGKRAAAVFETMDVSFAAGLIGRMREDAAADILSALPPEAAYAITAHVAGRNALAPDE